MKRIIIICLFVLVSACKTEKESSGDRETSKTVLDSIAGAYGFEHWKNVEQISYTFHVQRPDQSYQRSWKWDIANNSVTSKVDTVIITYNRAKIDSTLIPTDARFINDKYWLLVPFNLVWDRKNIVYTLEENSRSPISNDPVRKVTIVYGDTGGYTPGDAYDLYIDNDYMIREWAWRKNNEPTESLITQWQEIEDFDGLKLCISHRNSDATFQLSFRDLNIVFRAPK